MPPELAEFAYQDTPLPIESGQTISQPYIVALMAAALELGPGDRVLEIGTGSGYAAAVLSRMAREVYTVERHEELARIASRRLRDLGFDNVSVLHGDGTLGCPEHAPYDAIVVAAGGPKVPPPLLDQLAVGAARHPRRGGESPDARSNHAWLGRPALGGRPGRRPLRPPHRRRRLGGRGTGAIAAAAEPPGHGGRPDPRGRGALPGSRGSGSRSAPRAHRQRAARADRRGHARHLGVLPVARTPHAGADPLARIQHRRRRGRLAGRDARQPLRPGDDRSRPRLARLRAIPDVDVAQSRGSRLRRVAPRMECRAAASGGAASSA